MIHNFLLHLLVLRSATAYLALNMGTSNQIRMDVLNKKSNPFTVAPRRITIKMVTGISDFVATGDVLNFGSSGSRRKLNSRSKTSPTALYCAAPIAESDAFTAELDTESPAAIVNAAGDHSSHPANHEGTHDSADAANQIAASTGHEKKEWSAPVQSIEEPSVILAQKVPQPMVVTKMEIPAIIAPKKKENALKKFLKGNWLVLGEVLVIMLAHKNPSFGATGGVLKPEFFVSKLGVFTIFFINGIALSIEPSPDELQTASKTNSIIQLFNFAFIPLMAKALAPYYPEAAFRDGLLALSILPCTINICVAQTLSAGGNMGTAIFNAIFANVLGVFLTPLLAVWIMGAGKGISLVGTLRKLGGVVIMPLIAGQICRRTPLRQLAEKYTKYTRTLSSLLLLAIVYNVFSDTFVSGIGVGGSALVQLLVAMPVTYMTLSGIFWMISKYLLPGLDPETRAAALFCSAQKTLAFGIPFIKTAFGHRPDLAYILAPLLIYAPAQLLLGSTVLVPAMKRKIKKARDFEDGGGI